MKLSDSDLRRLKNEIVMAEKLAENSLKPQMIEAIRRYTGKHVPLVATADWDVILNELYPIIQYELPVIFFRSPRVFLKPRNKNFTAKRTNPQTGVKETVFLDSQKSAKTQEAILNYILSEIRYKGEVKRVLMDALLFKHGILWHGYKGEFGMTEEQSLYIKNEMVFVKRISPLRFLFDPAVSMSDLDEATWIGRHFDVRYRDLIEDDTLDVDEKEIKGLLGFGQRMESVNENPGGLDKLLLRGDNKVLLDESDKEFRTSIDSRFVRVYEIFQRPTKKEARDGGKGKIILYCKEQKKPLRVSDWPYKAEGWPAKILMFNDVPDQTFGMSDIEVFGGITDHKNQIFNLQLRNAQENSKVWVGLDKSGVNEEDVDRIKVGDQTIILFEGNPRDKMVVASPGGQASGELYSLDQRIQSNLDEKSGVSDLKKGTLRSGEESATSVQLRAQGSSARPAYRQDMMADFLRDSCSYLNQLAKQFFPVDKAVRIVGSLDIEWSDNPTKEEIQADTDVELDVISMLPENPDKEIQELTTILNLMTQALTNPAIAQKVAQEGKMFNISPIIENLLLRLRIRNPEVFRAIKPEESEGFVAVKSMREASANVKAALQGNPNVPVPPAEGQDHRAHLEVYGEIADLISGFGDSPAAQILQQLIQATQMLLEAAQQKESPEDHQPVDFSKPTMTPFGAR